VPENHFGEEVAARYDESSGSMFDADVLGPTVDVLAELAGGGAALEFAVGTGRVALPLAARGVPVSGIEFSTAMAERFVSRTRPSASTSRWATWQPPWSTAASGSCTSCTTRSGT